MSGLIYNPDKSPTGLLNNKGRPAGCLDGQGYYMTMCDGIRRKNHHWIWCMFNGPIPSGYHIDHINGVRSDNRLENLRLVTPSENSRNKKKQSNNTSGICKLTVREERNAIVVQWTDDEKIRHQRTFGYSRKRTFEEALELAKELAKEASKFYTERHGE